MDDLETLHELVAAEPDDYFTRFCLGKALIDAGRAGDAIEQLQQCIELNRDYPVAHRWLGVALQQDGRAEEARRVWEEGMAVADRTGLIQTGKEMGVLLRRLRPSLGEHD
ncbi:MAG TPA: tetratricopeptide repeat protein [Candidatus Xenobia bacterium]|jgi:Flp pilus assembly protein TadD